MSSNVPTGTRPIIPKLVFLPKPEDGELLSQTDPNRVAQVKAAATTGKSTRLTLDIHPSSHVDFDVEVQSTAMSPLANAAPRGFPPGRSSAPLTARNNNKFANTLMSLPHGPQAVEPIPLFETTTDGTTVPTSSSARSPVSPGRDPREHRLAQGVRDNKDHAYIYFLC